MAPPDFDKSVNPISTTGGRICPPNITGTPVFSDRPTALHHTITISVLSRVQAEPEPEWIPTFKVIVYKSCGKLLVLVRCIFGLAKIFDFKKLKVYKTNI